MRIAALFALPVVFVAGSASAQISASGISFTPNQYSVTNSTAQIFENFSGTGVAPTGGNAFGTGVATESATASSKGYTESAMGTVFVYPGSQNQVGTAVDPTGSSANNNYLAVGAAVQGQPANLSNPANTFTVNFGGIAQQYFSFAFGSLDNYNSVLLTFANGTTQLLSGLGIIGGVNTADGAAPYSTLTTGRVSYNAQGGSGITSVRFGSSQAAFEIDDLAAATPEPGTWALMIFGFGMAGAALRFRRRQASVSFA